MAKMLAGQVDALVSLPLVQINEITHGDSLDLTGCVPAKADLILEDMPYNTTACDWDKEPIDLKRYWESRMELIKPTGVICLTATQPFATDLISSNRKMFKYDWVWVKTKASNFQLAKHNPLKVHELILVFYDKKPTYNNTNLVKGNFKNSRDTISTLTNLAYRTKEYVSEYSGYNKSVLPIGSEHNPPHPTQKPVGLFEYLIRT